MPIQPKQPTAKCPAERFTGDVFLDPIARGEEPSRVRVSAVRFTPSAPHRLARPRRRPDPVPHRRQGPGPVPRRRHRGDPGRRHRHHAPRPVALARRRPRPLHDPPVHHRGPRRPAARGRLGRTRHRRRVLPTRYAGRLSAPDDLAALWMGADSSGPDRRGRGPGPGRGRPGRGQGPWSGRPRSGRDGRPGGVELDRRWATQAHPKRRMSGTWPGARVAVEVLAACALTAPRPSGR